MFARTRKPAPTQTPIVAVLAMTQARVDYALACGAARRKADHAEGRHNVRPVLGCPRCG